MISSKEDLSLYLDADLISSGKKLSFFSMLKDPVIRYQRYLRFYEYHANCSNGLAGKLLKYYYRLRLHRLSYRLGLEIPANVFGPGLAIVHCSGIVVSAVSKVGKNCRIHAGVNIGEWRGKAPVVGDNVYIGPGAKLIGNINVGDRCVIGANAVVCKDIPSDVTVGGVPAKVISDKNSADIIVTPGAG